MNKDQGETYVTYTQAQPYNLTDVSNLGTIQILNCD